MNSDGNGDLNRENSVTTEETTIIQKRPCLCKRLWHWFSGPSKTTALGTLLVGGVLLGVASWVTFNAVLDYTNTEKFCISCHTMARNYDDYINTVHFTNRSGQRATCADCHVPTHFGPKIYAKILASKDLYHEILGTIDTEEKYEARRLTMAQAVWTKMKSTDSRECRNCHDQTQMDYASQEPRAANIHQEAFKDKGTTCIDCHIGLSHKLPPGAEKAAADVDKTLGRKPFVLQQVVPH